mmetsp:Transcript_2278/g.3573  ORF Transcript_2278/g.3573 Transcript_2278/m.3573 type:complete len:293 (-) Transcript_2278:422-1300(-)
MLGHARKSVNRFLRFPREVKSTCHILAWYSPSSSSHPTSFAVVGGGCGGDILLVVQVAISSELLPQNVQHSRYFLRRASSRHDTSVPVFRRLVIQIVGFLVVLFFRGRRCGEATTAALIILFPQFSLHHGIQVRTAARGCKTRIRGSGSLRRRIGNSPPLSRSIHRLLLLFVFRSAVGRKLLASRLSTTLACIGRLLSTRPLAAVLVFVLFLLLSSPFHHFSSTATTRVLQLLSLAALVYQARGLVVGSRHCQGHRHAACLVTTVRSRAALLEDRFPFTCLLTPHPSEVLLN